MLVSYAIAAFFASAVSAQQNDPSINTPVGVTQCQTTKLMWSGTHPPFDISAIPGGQVGSTPLEDIIQSSDQSYSWLCNLAQGTYFTLQIRDSQGNLQYSSPVTVQNSGNSTCVGKTISSASSSTGSSSSTSTGSNTAITSSSSSSSGSKTSPTTSPTTGSSSSSGSSPSSSSSHNGAMPTAAAAQWSVAGLLGLVGAAVLA